MKSAFLAVVALISVFTCAAQLPRLAIPDGVGVNIHFTRGHAHDLDMIAAAGFKFVRMDLDWAAIEKSKGEYDWSAYDDLTADLEKRHLRAYYILDYSNPLYEGTAETKNAITGKPEPAGRNSPQHPASIDAFAKWAATAAEHFKGRHVIWEIWNEPNGFFWKPKPDVEQYTALALATCRAIRRADPQATIVAPASSGFPWDFLESFLKSGVMTYLDAASVHPYRPPNVPPETAASDYQRLRDLIARCAPDAEKKEIPIVSGEWGYSSNTKGVSLQTQADFLARQQLFNLFEHVPISIWYDWKNDGENPAENEHNFGVVDFNLKPKPAYLAIQTLTRELDGYSISRRYDTGHRDDFVLVFTNAASHTKLAVWTLGKSHRLTVPLGPGAAGEVSLTLFDGTHKKAEVEGQRLSIELDGSPKYVALGIVQLQKK